jgi:hypothetical protein
MYDWQKKILTDNNSRGKIYIDLPRGIGKRRKMNLELNKNELYLLTESVRLHLEDICNFPEENGEEIIKELSDLLIRLEGTN